MSLEIDCGRCDYTYEITFDEEINECPSCGFSSEDCEHPEQYRDSRWEKDIGVGKDVEVIVCTKCGKKLD